MIDSLTIPAGGWVVLAERGDDDNGGVGADHVYGDDLARLRMIAKEVEAALKPLPGARDVAANREAISRSLDGHEAIIKAFNAALAARQKDGSHGAIVQRWEDLYADID